MLGFIKKNRNSILVLIPAIITFALVLIPTFKYSFPLNTETIYHAVLVQFYSENGISWVNLISVSNQGLYSPLFDFLILFINKITSVSYISILRYLQPILASLVVLSFSFTAYKMYNDITGFLTGIFVMFSILFYKIIFVTPETLILIIIPLLGYAYAIALENKSFKFSIISGMMLGLAFLTQTMMAFTILFVLTIFTIIVFLAKKEAHLKIYGLLVLFSILIAALWWLPLVINGLTSTSIFIPQYMSQIIAIGKYPEFLGLIPLIFAFIGAFFLIKRKEIKDILILTWLISIVILSFVQFLFAPIGAEFILLLAIFPLMVMAGVGVQCIRIDGDKRPIHAIIIVLLILGSYYGFNTVNSMQPQSASSIDVGNWFKNNGDQNKIVISNNSSVDMAVFVISNQTVATGPYSQGLSNLNIKKYLLGKYNNADIINDNVGYIVMEKNVSSVPYAQLVYENKDFKIFEIKSE